MSSASKVTLFGTKAQTLERVSSLLRSARVLPQCTCTVAEWRANPAAVIARVLGQAWGGGPLIVRSSAIGEDGAAASQAGRFRSVPDVLGEAGLRAAVDAVIASYEGSADDANQVLVQPMLRDCTLSGVAFSCDPNSGAPYYVINYATGNDTAAVTGSRSESALNVYYYWKHGQVPRPRALSGLIAMLRELEDVFAHQSLDVEFAYSAEGTLFLLQVRPLVRPDSGPIDTSEHRRLLEAIAGKVAQTMRPHPHLHGARTVYGIMPDWNPAEIIGIRPRPLALSLYRELVTDAIWAYQRNNYGYKNLRSFPLLIDFHGLPYIDVRVSFNSFVPKDVPSALADKLVNYYIDQLVAAPALHDRVEFDIVFSCYTFDLPQRLSRLADFGFTKDDRATLARSLRELTNNIINGESGLWRADSAKIAELERRHSAVMASDIDAVAKIYWLLEDCKRYGTLPFAGLARAAFIAVQLLRSLVGVGVLGERDYAAFMAGLDTVSGAMVHDFAALPRRAFLTKYGHLRPGTYDILSARYDETPDRYFDWSSTPAQSKDPAEPFVLSLKQMRAIEELLREHGLKHDIVGLFEFLKAAIEGREYSKFAFTRNLSDALALMSEFGIAREELSYADVAFVRELYAGSGDPAAVVRDSIERGKAKYARSKQIVLPPLIVSPEETWAFHIPAGEPHFITQRAAEGAVAATPAPHAEATSLAGKIVMIPSADPGFDWLFSHDIAGFITSYGGVNSHMAIRAGELNLPAVIGAGELYFQKWASAHSLRIDGERRSVEILR